MSVTNFIFQVSCSLWCWVGYVSLFRITMLPLYLPVFAVSKAWYIFFMAP